MQTAEQMHKPPLARADSLEDTLLQLHTNVWGRPVVVDQIIGLTNANVLKQYKRREDRRYSWTRVLETGHSKEVSRKQKVKFMKALDFKH